MCVCVYRDRDEAFIDAYLSSVHSNGCEYLDLEEVLISCRTDGMRSCIPIVSLSPSSFQSRNVYLIWKRHPHTANLNREASGDSCYVVEMF